MTKTSSARIGHVIPPHPVLKPPPTATVIASLSAPTALFSYGRIDSVFANKVSCPQVFWWGIQDRTLCCSAGGGIGTGCGAVHPAFCNACHIWSANTWASWSPCTYQSSTLPFGFPSSDGPNISLSLRPLAWWDTDCNCNCNFAVSRRASAVSLSNRAMRSSAAFSARSALCSIWEFTPRSLRSAVCVLCSITNSPITPPVTNSKPIRSINTFQLAVNDKPRRA